MQQEALKNLQKKVFPYQQCIILIVITDIYMRDIIICFTELKRIGLLLLKCLMTEKILCISCLVFQLHYRKPLNIGMNKF